MLKSKKLHTGDILYYNEHTNDPIAISSKIRNSKTIITKWHPDFASMYPATGYIRHMFFPINAKESHIARKAHEVSGPNPQPDAMKVVDLGVSNKTFNTGELPYRSFDIYHHKTGQRVATMHLLADDVADYEATYIRQMHIDYHIDKPNPPKMWGPPYHSIGTALNTILEWHDNDHEPEVYDFTKE